MLDQAHDFHIASGKFQVLQKKEEFESYFRTPGFGGYHLLQLNDFPGQGTSPVGVVDVFYDAKPYVDAQTFKQMQSLVFLYYVLISWCGVKMRLLKEMPK